MKIPNVLMRHTSRIVHAVFYKLYEISEDGYLYLNADLVAMEIGSSRSSVYTAISWLTKVNLLKCVRKNTGRGRRSYYFLNWRKPNSVPVNPDEAVRFEKWKPKTIEELSEKMEFYQGLSPELQKRIDLRAEANSRLKCPALYKRSIKNQKTPKDERLRRHTLLHFRAFFKKHSGLSPNEVQMCLQVIGKRLKSKPIGYRKELIEALWNVRESLSTPRWVWLEPKKTYAWFGWVLKNAENAVTSA